MRLTGEEKQQLISDIANRVGTASELAKWYGTTVSELRSFVDRNKQAIEDAVEKPPTYTQEEPTPTQLDELWLTNKFQRLLRLQHVSDLLYKDIQHGSLAGTELATATREFRSYLMLAANELGQLLHRGSGDTGSDEMLSVDMQGIDMEKLR